MRFFLDTVLDHLTSEAVGTQNFKVIAIFNMCFKNEYQFRSELWARPLASNLSDWWPLKIFLVATQKNAKNGCLA